MSVSQPYPYPQPPQAAPPQAHAPVGYAPQHQPPRPGGATGPRPNLLHAVASEWTKLWTTRATLWLLASAVVAMPAVDLLLTTHYSGNDEVLRNQFLTNSAIGALFALLLFVPFGTLVITSEYTTGMIRNTFIAAPNRAKVLTAKVLVLFLGSLLAGTALSGLSVTAAKLMLPGNFGDPVPSSQVMQAIFGSGLFLALSALLSFAIGTLLRRSAPTIVILMIAIFLPFVIGIFAHSSDGGFAEKLMDYSLFAGLLEQFGQQFSDTAPSAGTLLEVLAAVTVLLLGGAYAALIGRDA